jgi:hypothetical protein
MREKTDLLICVYERLYLRRNTKLKRTRDLGCEAQLPFAPTNINLRDFCCTACVVICMTFISMTMASMPQSDVWYLLILSYITKVFNTLKLSILKQNT